MSVRMISVPRTVSDLCEVCGEEVARKNGQRNFQRHLVSQHFSVQLESVYSVAITLLQCPYCTFSTQDLQSGGAAQDSFLSKQFHMLQHIGCTHNKVYDFYRPSSNMTTVTDLGSDATDITSASDICPYCCLVVRMKKTGLRNYKRRMMLLHCRQELEEKYRTDLLARQCGYCRYRARSPYQVMEHIACTHDAVYDFCPTSVLYMYSYHRKATK
jgi:hypothetical protein